VEIRLVESTELAADPLLLAQIVAVSDDAIFSQDLQGRITSWNAAAVKLFGFPARDIIGQHAVGRLPDETVEQLRLAAERVKAGVPVSRRELVQTRVDGTHFVASVSVFALRGMSGESAGCATVVRDDTDRVRMEAEAEDRQRVASGELVRLEHSNRDLEQFAHLASHDLSEPLRVMTGFVQLLEQRYAGSLDERGTRYIRHVVEGAARMRTLINDLLEYSCFLRPEAVPDGRVDAAELLRRVARSLDATGLEVGDLPVVWGDPVVISVMWRNLISNAMKFRRPDEGTRIAVSGWVEGSRVVLCVDDNGIGIEPECRERVFGIFTRLHVREAYPGSGLGLAIVRQIAERAGGGAWADESPLGGSRFCVSLPAPPTGWSA
jgi:PAS domain S-box-containing protein